MEDEDIQDPPPPSADKVARRAIVLSVVSCRGVVEGDRENPGAADLAKRSCDWLMGLGLEGELSDWERRVLNSPFGSLSDRDSFDASWLSEATCVLAWALGRGDLPGYEEQCDPAAAANSLGFLDARENTALHQPNLREPTALREYNEFIYNLHWRVRDFSLRPGSYDFESLARKAWGEPVLRHGLKIAAKDLCVDGVSIAFATDEARQQLASITQERHRASNWLIGYASEDFYEVTTDT
jgi:hypothetical protein